MQQGGLISAEPIPPTCISPASEWLRQKVLSECGLRFVDTSLPLSCSSQIKHEARTSPRCVVVLPWHIPGPRWNSKGPQCQCPHSGLALQPWFVECRCQRGLLCRWRALLTCFPTAEAINVTPWHSLDCLTPTIMRLWDGDTSTLKN